jgi:hypothetical protein
MVSDAQDRIDRVGEFTAAPDEASAPFVGKWNRLVSRTNWEKGRIICAWREALVEAGAEAYQCSDEAWAARVGGISSQHVGRLRRVWQRFGATHENYDGLYWSHFLIAMDWEDAEMWLEGATQSGWSVSQMRGARWETLGAPDDLKPREEDIVAGEWDEDSPLKPVSEALRITGLEQTEAVDVAEHDAVGSEEHDTPASTPSTEDRSGHQGVAPRPSAVAGPVRPFANVPELPEDLAEAFEQFKIAILAHRITGWQETSSEDVVAALEALKVLALAPAEESP